jgi:ppGpp synthetase/RelA/SpoT-type nucleotidyltranferase
MKVIDDFIKQYNKEFDYYQKLSQIVANKVEDQLFKRGLKAIVTYRAKRPDRLKDKLIKRNEEKHYKNIEEIFQDIVDLAGIRIALYFPSEREIIDEIIKDLFHIDKKKEFPNEAHTPLHTKRFSGYWATHYRIKLKEESINKRYLDTLAEIQVASVLMHAWSEVEHDLVYKPFSGDISKEEYAILDEINGLVITGEIALERLQSAMAERTRQKKNITDKYELTNYLINTIMSRNMAHNIGNTSILNNYLNTTKFLDINNLNNYIDNININSEDSITDQILNELLIYNYDNIKPNLKTYFKNLNIPEKRASSFESFVKCWVVLEKAVREFLSEDEIKSKKYMVPDFKILKEKKILTAAETTQLSQIRQVRNYLLHGIETPPENYLKNSFQILKRITEKVVDKVPTKSTKDKLKNELEAI